MGFCLGNPGPPGDGRLIQDHLGAWITGFSHYLGHTTNLTAELWALRDGLRIALQHDIKFISVEVDALDVIQIIQKANDLRYLHTVFGPKDQNIY